MRATIATEEFQYAAGLFKREPRWKVKCAIEFSDEELAIIRQRNLGDLHVYSQQFVPGEQHDEIPLKQVVKHGIWSVFVTPVDAKNFEHEVANSILPSLKKYLTASSEVDERPKVLEF